MNNKYDNLFGNSKEDSENRKTEQNLAALDDIFKNSVNFDDVKPTPNYNQPLFNNSGNIPSRTEYMNNGPSVNNSPTYINNGSNNPSFIDSRSNVNNSGFINSGSNNPSFIDKRPSVNNPNYINNGNNNYLNKGLDNDPLEKTGEIGKVELEQLKQLKRVLQEEERRQSQLNIPTPPEGKSSSSEYGGKQKVLSTKPVNKFEDKSKSEDVKEILSAFVSCSILSFVTAGMGVGWLVYILMHI